MVIMATHILGKDELTVQSCLEALIRSKVISILCDKHRLQYRERMIAAGFPDGEVNSENTKGMPEEEIDSLVVRAGRVSIENPLDNEDCPNCSIIGLSKSGRIEELDSPNDWMFT